MFEHIGKSFRTGHPLNTMPFSAIREHSHENDHLFSENDFKILERLGNTEETLIGEKLLIDKYKPQLNTLLA